MKKIFLLALITVIFISGCTQTIGGDRDSHGCLGPAGFSFDDELKVCARSWETIDVNQRNAIKIAAEDLEQYGLTLDSINTYELTRECRGCYVVYFTNPDYEQFIVTLENWQIVENKYTEVHAYHILVSTKEEADTIKKELDAGGNFQELAKDFSTCPSGVNGGDLGWFGKGMMIQEFEDAVFALNVNEISEPVQTQFGWHIILVIAKR